MRRERAYMNMPDTEEDEEWEQFEITLFSNRQLTFEKLTPPFVFGSIELPAAKSLRLMKVQYNVNNNSQNDGRVNVADPRAWD